jgi:hypothetical protein
MKNKTQQETWNVFPGTPSSYHIKYISIIYNKMLDTVTTVESSWALFQKQ